MNYDLIRIPLEKDLAHQLYDLIEGDIIDMVLKEAKIERFENEWKLLLEGHSFKVTKEMAPWLYDLFHEVKDTLEFKEDIHFYVTNAPDVNAFALSAAEEGEANIININAAPDPHRIYFDFNAYLEANDRIVTNFKENRGQNLSPHPINPIRINFMASAGLLITGADDEITQKEVERIMSIISRVMIFQKQLAHEIHNSGKVMDIFNTSSGAIISQNPGEL